MNTAFLQLYFIHTYQNHTYHLCTSLSTTAKKSTSNTKSAEFSNKNVNVHWGPTSQSKATQHTSENRGVNWQLGIKISYKSPLNDSTSQNKETLKTYKLELPKKTKEKKLTFSPSKNGTFTRLIYFEEAKFSIKMNKTLHRYLNGYKNAFFLNWHDSRAYNNRNWGGKRWNL